MRLIVFSTSEINLPIYNAYERNASPKASDYLVNADNNHPQKLDDLYVYDFDDEFLQLFEYHKWSKDEFVKQVLKTSWPWGSKDKELGEYGHGYLDNPSSYDYCY